ncbi:MAG: AAA family ATPase [Nannocystaceae bacterium]
MLTRLELTDVGPAAHLEIELAPRLNFLTGDNGLGKTFLLDLVWWSLSGTWSRMPAAPNRGPGVDPKVSFTVGKLGHPSTTGGTMWFKKESQSWSAARPSGEQLVVQAHIDGGFSVWDPVRNRHQPGGAQRTGLGLPPFMFASDEVWDGLPRDAARKRCNGLIQDWAAWQRENNEAFALLSRILTRLSPSPEEPLRPGALLRVSLDDVRDHPSIAAAYGQDVALVHASAGIRRIVALAYVLVWTWQEHLRACELVEVEPVSELVFLFDEVEAHLHPQWQRRLVPALLDVIDTLSGTHELSVQLIVTTHSPLVLASAEPSFDPQRDAVFNFDLVDGEVQLEAVPWQRRGDVNSWLSSTIFDLDEPRSVEAEEAIARALALLRQDSPPTLEAIEAADERLRGVLGDVDRFWVRWSAFVESAQGRG